MPPLPQTEEFCNLAQRIIWFETPSVALHDGARFMAYAFRYATFQDMKTIRAVFNDDDLRKALATAPPGIIDARSWSYWHAVLGVFPPPQQPTRTFNEQPAQF
jgi:hypothetical protein